jgi:hypothetical protein
VWFSHTCRELGQGKPSVQAPVALALAGVPCLLATVERWAGARFGQHLPCPPSNGQNVPCVPAQQGGPFVQCRNVCFPLALGSYHHASAKQGWPRL